jgi:ADP-ribose pyrophosphatase YjhB (NUDIX family)
MQIKSTLTNKSGQVLTTEYNEGVDPMQNLDGKILQGVHAYCFYKDKLVIVYTGKKGKWTPPGGHIEDGETYEEAVTREVMEESNMKVLHQELIGFIDVYESDKTIRQTRSFCVVEPYGDFVSDMDNDVEEGDITEMKLIDPKDYKQYFDWGEVGDRIMQRAMELKEKFK